ncbi:MAG: patatin-like phospholipase family protein [Anaerolineaceae bacterium]|nr:patatin-like phospholipase family protein [Anaerolineaceae bacterium]
MKNISLALGGGGTKGFAHIGVIRQLENMGFKINAIAGTSAGGIVGALYSYGFSIEELVAFSRNLRYSDFFNRSHQDAPSVLGLGGLYKQLEKLLGKTKIEELKLKFASISVDTNSGKEVIFDSGSVVNAVKATTAVPGIFPAQRINGLNLVDGGVLNPVPVLTARWLKPELPVFAVSLTPQMKNWPNVPRLDIPPYVPIPQFFVEQLNQLRLGQAMHVFIDSMEIMVNTVADLRLKLEKPDVIIRPEVHKFTMFDKVDVDEMIYLGSQAVLDSEKEIESAFSVSNRLNRWFKVANPPGILVSELP